MKQLIFLLSLCVSTIVNAQDIIYVVSGDYNGDKTPLDSIIVDNITNGTSISFGDLPEHDYYQINLSQNAYWGSVSVFDLEEPSNFEVQKNTLGSLSIKYGGSSPTDVKVSVINVNGQTLYKKDNLFLHPQNSLQVKLGFEGVLFIKIESSEETKTFKAIGGDVQTGYDVEISDGINTKFVSSQTLKSTTLIGEGDFTFEEGDSIRIWAFRKDIYAWPEHMRIKESGDVHFQFDDFIYIEQPESAYPDSIGELISFKVDNETLYCQKINGEYVFQGDIILTESQIYGDSTKGAYVTDSKHINFWPNAEVFYEIDDELDGDKGLIEALSYWNMNCPVKFIERKNEETNYVKFVKVDGGISSSYLGMIGNEQKISIAGSHYGTIVHEMGHAVGLIHEHSRSDRNDFIKVHWENIDNYWENRSNFSRFTSSVNVGPFDFGSIMLYSSNSFSKNIDSPTMTLLEGKKFSSQRNALSYWDIKTIETIYGVSGNDKPKVNIEYSYDSDNLALDITATLIDEGDSEVTEKTISWKKIGDSEYNHEYFYDSNDQFNLRLPVEECGEYLFYASASNNAGISTSIFKSFKTVHFVSLNVKQETTSTALLQIEVDRQPDCIDRYDILIWEGLISNNINLTNPLQHDFIDNVSENEEYLFTGLETNKWYSVICRKWNFDGSSHDYLTTFQLYDIEKSFLTDSRDNKTYNTVKIGDQWWMAENLSYLPNVSYGTSASETSPCFYVYGYYGTNVTEAKALENYNMYGVLYNWPAALTACPDNWHLPSDDEWEQLAQYINDYRGPYSKSNGIWENVGMHLKSESGWKDNGNGTDDFEFSALPSGINDYGNFIDLGSTTVFWSATENKEFNQSWYRSLNSNFSHFYQYYYDKKQGYSVRCVKD